MRRVLAAPARGRTRGGRASPARGPPRAARLGPPRSAWPLCAPACAAEHAGRAAEEAVDGSTTGRLGPSPLHPSIQPHRIGPHPERAGRAAEEALNVFYYLTYEGSVDLDALADPAMVRRRRARRPAHTRRALLLARGREGGGVDRDWEDASLGGACFPLAPSCAISSRRPHRPRCRAAHGGGGAGPPLWADAHAAVQVGGARRRAHLVPAGSSVSSPRGLSLIELRRAALCCP